MLPPVIQNNYGQWLYHERVKPGVLRHVAESGEEIYTVGSAQPAWSAPIGSGMSVKSPTSSAEVILRFTSRHNLEFLVSDKDTGRAVDSIT